MTGAVARPDPPATRATLAGTPGAVVVAALEDIPVGEGRAYTVAGQQIAVFRPRNGPLRAVSARCPHAGGPLADGQIDDDVLICPLHLNLWELATGKARSHLPDLLCYPVEVVEAMVVVSTSSAAAVTCPAATPPRTVES